jgi:phosphohistidine phosphatase SixA
MRLSALLACLCLLLPAVCAAPQARDGSVAFIVVRHAEKAKDDPRDPSLSETGQKRALALARTLQDQPIVAAYATQYRRTRQTAQPAADAHGVTVIAYDADVPASALAAQLRRDHASGAVLVVGHSNTVPDIVSALCGCAVPPLAESDYGDLYRVSNAGGATPQLTHEHF